MNIYKIGLLLYTFLIDLFCLILLVFLGVLADENVQFDKFAQNSIFGFQYDFNFLIYFVLLILVLTLITQGFLVEKRFKNSKK